MGLYKEVDHFFGEYGKLQERIYDDACDIGIMVEGPNDPLCLRLADIFADRGGYQGFLGGIKKHRSSDTFANGALMYSTVIVYLPWENVEGSRTEYNCTKWDITYNNDPMKRKQFISFTACHAVAYESEIWEGGK